VAVLLGLALGGAGVWHTWEAVARLSGPIVAGGVVAGRGAPPRLDAAAAQDLLAATRHAPPGPARDARRGLAWLVLGDWAAAERSFGSALARAPADPVAWTRLALVRHRLGRAPDAVAAALGLALRTGPRVAHLAPLRGELALRYWPHLKPPARRRARVQIRLAWRQAPSALRRAAAATGREAVLTLALGRRPDRGGE